MSEKRMPQPPSPDILSNRDLPVEETPFVVLDLETTGLKPSQDEILAVGAVRMHGPRILVGQTFYRLISPQRHRWDTTVSVHRLRPQDVAHAPPASEVLAAFWEYCQDCVLAGYRVGLDRGFLAHSSPMRDAWIHQHLWIDIHRLAVWMERRRSRWPWRRKSVSLEMLAQRYHLPVLQRHHALADAYLAAQILQRQLFAARQHGIRSLIELYEVAGV